MIKLITGKKGTGKTKKLIEMANESAKTNEGQVVFIDNDKRHMYDLNINVRFTDIKELPIPLSNYKELIGFLCGIISQNSDITEIYIDGLQNIVSNITLEDTINLKDKLLQISKNNHNLNFITSTHFEADELPPELKEYCI